MSSSVFVVVVTYNPEIEALRVVLNSIIKQAKSVFLVDNASSNVDQIELLAQDLNSEKNLVEVVVQSRNLGLGAAHNIGISEAKDRGFDYVLLLDQDSIVLDNMLPALLLAYQKKSENELVSATGVTYLNADNGSESFFVRFGWLKFKRQYCASRDSDGCVEADFLISSGSLMAIEVINEIGGMDEGLFIDHVDTEWFLRARHKGYKCYGVCDAVMQHGLGETTHQISFGINFLLRKLFGLKNARRRNVPQHNSFRYYYIFRNSVLLYRRSYASNKWKWNDLQRLFMIAFMFTILKPPRRENLWMMLRGIKDGIRGIDGRFQQN